MAFDLSTITKGPRHLPPRVVLLGVEKVGKSTFASQWPNAVFLPVKGEQGIDALDVASFPTLEDVGQIIEALGVLYTSEHEYQTVVIDSASALEPIIMAEAMRREGVTQEAKLGGGYGRQFDTALVIWREILAGLDALREDKGVASILIGHTKVASFNDPQHEPYDVYDFDVAKPTRAALFRWADAIYFANRKTFTTKVDTAGPNKTTHATGTDESVLYTRKRPAHPGGGRGIYGQLPYELPLAYDAFATALVNAETAAAPEADEPTDATE